MAKKETKTATAPAANTTPATTTAPATPAKPTAAEREAQAAKDTFKYKGEPTKRVAPQAQGIVNILKANPDGMTRQALVDAMTGVIQTRQPNGRILSYYQKQLIELDAIEMVKAS